MCVGSSVEELTQGVNEYLDPALANLHFALLDAFANHPTLPLYKWLNQETTTFLMNAASASMNMGEYIANYFEEVQEKLIYDLEKDTYKKSAERKKDLFYHLIKFYKAVMLFKADIGKRILSVSDDSVTIAYIEKLNEQYEIAKKIYLEYQEMINKIQREIEDDFQYLTVEKFLNNFTKILKSDLENQLIFFSRKYQEKIKYFRESKLDSTQLLLQVEEELHQLNHTNNDKIQRRDFDINNLVDESIISSILSQQFSRLDDEINNNVYFFEEKLQENCQATFGKVFRWIAEARSDLLRQKSILDILSAEDSVKFVDIEPSIQSLRLSVSKQSQLSFHSKWCSKNPGSIFSSLDEIQRAATFTYALSPICNLNTLRARREKIDIKLYTLDEKLQEMKAFEDELDKFNNKTLLLKKEFTDKKNKLAISSKSKVSYMQKKVFEETQAQLNVSRNQYRENLKNIARQCRLHIENQNNLNMIVQVSASKSSFSIDQHHFALPKSRKYLLPGIFSGFSGVAIASLFAVFTATTPVGLIVAVSMASALLLTGTAVFLTKAYNCFKKNKMLRQHDEAIQENLFRANDLLKKKKFDSTTRHLMMKYNITIDKSVNDNLGKKVKCVMAGINFAQFFLDAESGKLQIVSEDNSKIELVDAKNFQAQLGRFQLGKM